MQEKEKEFIKIIIIVSQFAMVLSSIDADTNSFFLLTFLLSVQFDLL